MVIDMNYWSKVARKLFILILTIIGLYLGFKLAVFYIPFLIAFILYLLIEPCIRFLMKKFKLRRRTSAIIVFSVVILIVTGITAWGIVTLVQEASNLLGGLNGYFEKGTILLNNFTEYFKTSKIQIPDEVQNILQNSNDCYKSSCLNKYNTKIYEELLPNEDIDILRDITVKSVLKAIGLERAFSSTISNNIDLIRKELEKQEDSKFDKWIKDNIAKIKENEFEKIEIDRKNYEIKKNVFEYIDKLRSELN